MNLTTPEVMSIHALLLEKWLSSQSDLRNIFPPQVHSINKPAILSQIKETRRWQIDHHTLGSIHVPTLIIGKDKDLITLPDWLQRLQRPFRNPR